jgi:hypothetical protein
MYFVILLLLLPPPPLLLLQWQVAVIVMLPAGWRWVLLLGVNEHYWNPSTKYTNTSYW